MYTSTVDANKLIISCLTLLVHTTGSWLPKMQEAGDFHTGYVVSVTYSPLVPQQVSSNSVSPPICWQRILRFKQFKTFLSILERYSPAPHTLYPTLSHAFPHATFSQSLGFGGGASGGHGEGERMEGLDLWMKGVCVHPQLMTAGGSRGETGGEVAAALFDLVGFDEAVTE